MDKIDGAQLRAFANEIIRISYWIDEGRATVENAIISIDTPVEQTEPLKSATGLWARYKHTGKMTMTVHLEGVRELLDEKDS